MFDGADASPRRAWKRRTMVAAAAAAAEAAL
jgi:hypothetical protein